MDEREPNDAKRLWRLASFLNDAENLFRAEADTIASRRPHPDSHLYDMEESFRLYADHLEDWREEMLTNR